jgi:cellulose synthase/poly-beta-1,6-N-acetylglucosamine synthase-like glycosyltransferase
MVLVVAFILLFGIYCLLILFYYWGFVTMPVFIIDNALSTSTTMSVLIPARNEAANISFLLADIMAQNFPKEAIQVIVIDDHSTDETVSIVEKTIAEHPSFNLKLLKLSDTQIQSSFKKKAIDWAIQHATGKLIVTTDADCRVPENWLLNLAAFYEQHDFKIIAAPVKYLFNSNSLLEKFQALDFLSLIGITAASVHTRLNNMCNGANLCYEKAAFQEVNGFRGNDHLSSGDDLFLIHKIAALYPKGVGFLKSNEACVNTYPKESWLAFVEQRTRWSSKSTSYAEKSITAILTLVYVVNFLIPVGLVASIWYPSFLLVFLSCLLVKSIIDVLFLTTVTRFFGQSGLMRSILPIGTIHIFYIIIVGFLGQFKSFEWKGRVLKK